MNVLNSENLKKITEKIKIDEEKKYHQKIAVYAFTKKELFEYKKKLDDNEKWIFSFIDDQNYWNYRALCWCCKEKSAVFIGVDNYVNYFSFFNDLVERKFVLNLYHEIRHVLQDLNINNSEYMNNVFDLENIIIHFSYPLYIKKKNKFLCEIDADKYALSNTKKYLLKTNSDSLKEIEKLKRQQKLNDINLYNYDIKFLFCELENIVFKIPGINNEIKLIKLLFDNEGKIKDIVEILENNEFKKLNNLFQIDIIYYFYINNMCLSKSNNMIKKILENLINTGFDNTYNHLAKINELNNYINQSKILIKNKNFKNKDKNSIF